MAKYLVKIGSTERAAESEQEILQWFLTGQCFPGNFVYHYESKRWTALTDLPTIASCFSEKPALAPEKNIVYVMHVGKPSYQEGPYSLSRVKGMLANGELSALSWIFVEGDKEWRQVHQVKILREAMPNVPQEQDTGETPRFGIISQDSSEPLVTLAPEVVLDNSGAEGGELEENTRAFSALGLSMQPAAAPSSESLLAGIAIPSSSKISTSPSLPNVAAAPDSNDRDQGSFDGITAEIPADPIWLIKKNDSEQVLGPFRYLEVMKFLEDGMVSKNDKISKLGSNRYIKILQQYEFNVKYSVETVMESGEEKQKILIRRRHPRVPYMADAQIIRNGIPSPVVCVNISAGGILVEASKLDLKLGEAMDIKIFPGMINRMIMCKVLVIGRIPKIPPGYALKFETLKQDDKEAIEHYVQNALKKEQVVRA